MFIIITPFNLEPATHGNGTMISFDANSPEQVKNFHTKVLELGGTNEGDPEGNKMNFFHYLPASASASASASA